MYIEYNVVSSRMSLTFTFTQINAKFFISRVDVALKDEDVSDGSQHEWDILEIVSRIDWRSEDVLT